MGLQWHSGRENCPEKKSEKSQHFDQLFRLFFSSSEVWYEDKPTLKNIILKLVKEILTRIVLFLILNHQDHRYNDFLGDFYIVE